MFSSKKIITTTVLLACLLVSHSASAQFTERGVASLGGAMYFQMETAYPKNDAPSSTGGMLAIAPSVGYFFSHGIELIGNVNITKYFSDYYSGSATEFGFRVGFRGVLDTRTNISPYIGVLTGPDFTFLDNDQTRTLWGIGVPVGILIAIFKNVAINLGLQPQFLLGISSSVPAHYFRMPVGMLGVEAFF